MQLPAGFLSPQGLSRWAAEHTERKGRVAGGYAIGTVCQRLPIRAKGVRRACRQLCSSLPAGSPDLRRATANCDRLLSPSDRGIARNSTILAEIFMET